MNVWRLITHHREPDDALRWIRDNERVAIGWGAIGDIGARGYTSPADVSAAILENYPDATNAAAGGPVLWNFFQEVRKGDLVILSASKPRVAVVEVMGDYEWTSDTSDFGNYQHQRRVREAPWDIEALWRRAGGAAPGQSPRWTLIRCTRSVP